MALQGQGLRHAAGGAFGGVAVKIRLTYQPEEHEGAAADLAVLLQRHPGAKVRRDKSKAPKLIVYLTTNSRETLDKSGKTLDPSPR